MGKLFVIEGLDGSGKSTQVELVEKELRRLGKDIMTVSFPDYASDSSALVRMYLGGDFGRDPGDVNAYAASSFYAVDRYASYKKNWKDFYHRENTVVLAARYTTSNEIHQLAKLERDGWDDFIEWLEDYEYGKLGIPKPDAVIYLDMKYEIAMSLVSGRSEKTGQKKDIHELDTDYMQKCHQAAAFTAEKLGWHKIVCYEGDKPRSPESITAAILNVLSETSDISEKKG